MADVQIAVIDDTENVVNVAVPGIQGPIGTTGSVTIAQAGTAATPGIRFESDTNTGIYSPGADQLAVSTGGTGRLFVDASGNVATGLAAFPKAFTVNNVNAAIELRANSGGAGFTAYSDHGLFFAVDATKYAQIYNDGVGQLIFRNGAGLTERMRIDSSGRVGIGTASPQAAWVVSDASANGVEISPAGASSIIQSFNRSTSAYTVLNYAGIQHVFTNGSTERLRIDSSGRVGIGTSAPSDMLHINGGQIRIQRDVPQILFRSNDGTSNQYYVGANISDAVDGGFVIGEGPGITGGTPRIAISAAGNVGIGTSSPSSALSIDGASAFGSLGSGAPIITLKNTNTSNFNTAQIVNQDSGGNLAGGILFRNDSHGASGNSTLLLSTRNSGTIREALIIGSNGTTTLNAAASTAPFIAQINTAEAARIDSSGRLLVGTSTSTGHVSIEPNFQMAGSNYANGTIGLRVENTNANTAPGIFLARSRGSSATIVVDGDRVGFINFAPADGAGYGSSAARIDCNIDGTPGAGDMPGRLVFSTTADGAAVPTERLRITSAGNVGIGTSSPAVLLDCQGAGSQTIRARTNDTSGVAVGILRAEYQGGGGGTNTNVELRAGDSYSYLVTTTNHPLLFGSNGTERARIDSSGRLLVGTSTARANYFNATVAPQFQVEGGTSGEPVISVVRNANDAFSSHLLLSKTRGAGNVIVADGDTIGSVGFQGNDGSEFVIAATIAAQVDGTPGANDMPGRLVFSTTADGAATPTERLRITSAGVLQVADAGNITVGTTTGTKIGTGTTQKLGFYNATPVVQPTAVADATDAASAITQLNALLTRMRNLGLIAT